MVNKMQDEGLESKFINFLEDFGESVKEIKYDGWPLWWFFKDNFFKDDMRFLLFFPRREEIIAAIKNKEELNLLDKLMNNLKIFALRKALCYNEKSKSLVSRFNQKSTLLEEDKDTIMFLAHTNAILFKNSEEDFDVDRIESVIKEVREDPNLQEYISIIEPLTHNSKLRILKYPNLIYNFMDSETQKNARITSSDLNKKWNKIRNKLEFNSEIEKKIFEYLGPILEFYFSSEVTYFAILYYEIYKKIIKEKKIKLLTLYSSSRLIIRCAIAAAHSSGIQSLTIWHAMGLPDCNLELPNSTYYVVPGEAFKDKFVALGVTPDNVLVTGPVFMDYIIKYRERSSKRVRHLKPKDQKEVIFATSPFVEFHILQKKLYFDYVGRILREINKIEDNIHLMIKLHPSERFIKKYEDIIESISINAEIIKGQSKESLYELIINSDLVISYGSTVSFEAAMIGKPTIIIHIPMTGISAIMEHKDSSIHLNSPANLKNAILDILYDGKTQERLAKGRFDLEKKYMYKLDGKAGKRILKIMKGLVHHKLQD